MAKSKVPSVKKKVFAIYRYQILPIEQSDMGKLFKSKSVAELKKKKNQYFARILKEDEVFKYDRGEIAQRVRNDNGDIFDIHLGSNKPTKITHKDASEERVDNWPYIHIFINNDPKVQKIFIQIDRAIFSSTNVVKSIIGKVSILL